MTVRRARTADLDALFALRIEALETDPDAFLRTADEDRARGPGHLANVLAHEDGAVFVAERDGELVGMVGVYREAAAKWRHKANVWGMFVRPTARGRGLGGALLDAAIAHARGLGVRQVHLSAEATHVAALALYRARGFVVWGTEPRGTRDGGRSMDEVHLWLDLDRVEPG